jgi:hypothetical protein
MDPLEQDSYLCFQDFPHGARRRTNHRRILIRFKVLGLAVNQDRDELSAFVMERFC